jgi:hypothetical protein
MTARKALTGVVLVVGAGLASAGLLGLGPRPAATAAETPGKVLVVSAPRLVWQDIADQEPPAISAFLGDAAYGSLSVRAIGPRTDLGEGYVTIGAGNRARVDPQRAGDAYGADEQVGNATGAQLFQAATGADPGDARVLSLAVTEAREDADRLHYGSEPGALGQAVVDAGKRTAVIANADGGPPAGTDKAHREAALAMMDTAGRVPGGVVDDSLTVLDPSAPGGRRTDVGAVLQAFDDAWATDDVVLVELSDLERANRDLLPAEGPERTRGLAGPLKEADELFGQLLDRVDLSRDRVLLVSPAAPDGFGRLTVFGMAGPGIEPGLARSATTRRPGYVTLPDVGVTVLDALGIDPPESMNATAIISAGGSRFSPEQAAKLADADDLARFRDRAVGPVSVIYIVLQVLTYGLAALALVKRRRSLRVGVEIAALTILAVPLVAFLSGLTRYHEWPLAAYVVAVFAVALAVALVARLARRAHPFLPAFVLVAANWALQLVDIVTGGRLQLNTPFGYSPIVAGRFQGLGNLAFALLAASAVVVATAPVSLTRATWPDDAAIGFVMPRGFVRWAIVALALTAFVDGFPSLGSDVGGVLATVPAFAVVVMLLAGWRVSWRRLLVVGVGTVAALAALAAIDLARPADERTHLGRFASRLVNGDAGDTIHRKLQSNWSILTSSVWTWLVPAAVAFLAFLALRRHGFLYQLQRRVPGVRAGLIGALVVGVLGFALNDSGVAIPAMMFGIVLPWVTWLLLETERAP